MATPRAGSKYGAPMSYFSDGARAVDYIPRCPHLGRKILRMAKPLEPVYEFPNAGCIRLDGVVNHDDNDQRNGISI